MSHNPVVWFEIYVQDMPRATAFYETVLGIRLDKLDAPIPGLEMMAFPMQQDCVGAGGSLVKMEGKSSGGTSTIVYFACEDCAVEAARVAGAGGSVHQNKMPIGQYGFIALVLDTEGNMVGLHSMK